MLQRLSVFVLLAFVTVGVAADAAAAQQFGRNKVQYRTFDFQIIQTDHFDIYYYPEEREAALDAARMAERAYTRLSRLLQHEFQDRKPIILYASHADFQQTNVIRELIPENTGGYTEAIKDRMLMPFFGSHGVFEEIFVHEMVHSFQFDIMLNRGGGGQGQGINVPLWFIEGMAEYLTHGEVNVITSAFLRDAVLSGYLWDIGGMSQRPDYVSSYRFGQALWAYIGNTWGDEVVGVLLQRAARMPIQRAFSLTLGIGLGELSNEWQTAVRETYLPQTVRFERPTEVAAPVLRHGSLFDPSYQAPALSPDGERLAVFTARDGFFPDLWLVDAETGEFERRLVRSGREASFKSLRYNSSSAAFSPDGRYLAFSALTGGRDALYVYDLEEDEVAHRFELDLNAIASPTWSPDGRRIAFSGIDGGLSDLFVVDVDDGSLERLTDDRYADLFPSWSPDGETLAFSTDRGPGTSFEDLTFADFQVALYRLEDDRIEILPGQVGVNMNPVWLSDSRSLVWVGDRTGISNLYLYDLESDQLSMVTNLLSGVMTPSAMGLSPLVASARNTNRLAFVYFENLGNSIFTVDDPRGLTRVAVSELSEEASAPVFLAEDDREDEADDDGDVVAAADSVESADSIEVAAVDVQDDFVKSYYHGDDEFRPSELLPEAPATVQGPVSVLATLDSADYALPDTAGFQFRDYDVKFTPDIVGRPTIGAQVGGYHGNGVYGGSFISLSDMLGNHNIMLSGNINGSFSDAMFFGSYAYMRRRANMGVSVLQVPIYRFVNYGQVNLPSGDVGLTNIFTRDVVRQAHASINYPFSTFRRLELGMQGTFYSRDLLFQGANLSRGGEPVRETQSLGSASYYQPSAALVFDNTLFGYTGPIMGRRYRMQLARSFGDANFYEGLVDFRNYLNVNQSIILASRLVGLVRTGENANQFPIYWGGPYLLRGYNIDSFDPQSEECRDFPGSDQANCPMRHQLFGSSAALMNLEVRFPLLTELQIGFLGRFPPVDGVLFFDGGVAWDEEVCFSQSVENPLGCAGGATEDVHLVWDREAGQSPIFYREPLFSAGVGLRLNVFFAVLRMDYAWPLSRPDRSGVFSLSFGPSF